MRFLSMIRINETSGQRPSEQLMADMGKLMAEMTAAGSLLDTAGLRPTAEGVRVRLSQGRQTTTDGPFAETKEVIGGWAILEAESKSDALRIAREFMELHRTHWPSFEGEAEVRPMFAPGMGP